MRKNKMMRAASALLVAVLLTTSTISGTFAKYVTTASGSDTARVAKWGVEIDMTAFANDATDLFTKVYADDSSSGFTNTVEASADAVAPGTNSEGAVAFKLSGTPEVAVNVQFKVTDVAKNDHPVEVLLPARTGAYRDWTKAPYNTTFDLAADYYPVEFTLKDTMGTADPADDVIIKNAGVELKDVTLADIEDYLESAAVSKNYPANTDLAKILGGTTGAYTLSWKWDFENGDTDAEKAIFNAADTLLGNMAADPATYGVGGASTTIDFAIEITVTQVD